ncbi:MAG TPA: serine/threonine-protein kinase, partial [Pyrinomonadaceae bacterium]|nr:serine/threonine-protein kinase [Pyrinomonadaceae bacterium]
MLPPNTILQDRYRIVRQLGQGGMGTVYEAVDQRLNSIVAIKETHLTTEDTRRAFEREASLLANLRHRSLPGVIDHFSENDSQYLVMQFIPGDDLAQMLDARQAPFALKQILAWGDEILRTLEYLHGHNPPILHRDIKPSNLKLTDAGELFLLDFGLAKGAAGQMPTLLTSRSIKGYTPVYSPLEQIHGGGTDPRSDLYALGATLYHLMTGVAPVDAPARFL